MISKFLEKDSSGSITLLPEELEDMWHVYNLISKNDMIKATTIRYGRKEDKWIYLIYSVLLRYRRLQTESSTGSTANQRVRLNLTITVENVDFDPNVGLLRINGKVASENQYVKVSLLRLERWIYDKLTSYP